MTILMHWLRKLTIGVGQSKRCEVCKKSRHCCFAPILNQWHQNINQQYLFHLNESISYCKEKKKCSSVSSVRLWIRIMPSLCTRRNGHKLVKFFYMNITALPLQKKKKEKYSSQRPCLNYITSIDLERNEIKLRTFSGILNTDPSHPVMKNSRARMVAASSVMIILFLESLTASFIFAYLGLIYIDYLLRFRSLNAWIVNSRGISNKIWGLVYNINRFALWT